MIDKRDKFGKAINIYEIEPELLISLYWGNQYSPNQMGELFGCTGDCIRRKMIKYNIERRNISESTKVRENVPWNKGIVGIVKFSDETKKRQSIAYSKHKKDCSCICCRTKRGEYLSNYWNGFNKYNLQKEDLYGYYIIKHLTIEKIAKIYGCSYETIRKFLKIYKIKIRKPSTEGGNNQHTILYWGERRALYHKEKDWRKTIFERDKYTCQFCFKIGGNLEAHHIRSWKNYPNYRLDINNGITLCLDCHHWLHRIVSIKGNKFN